MKRQVFKGEITVFLSLVFVLIVSLVGSMVQSVSIQITRSMKRADTELAIESVFAEYNKEMLEEYGLFVKVGRDEKEISERLWFYGADEMEHEIRRMQLFTDDGGEAFYEQAIRAMGGEVLPIEKVSDTSIEKAEKTFGVDNLYDIKNTNLVHFNLIPINNIEGGKYTKSSMDNIIKFRDYLNNKGGVEIVARKGEYRRCQDYCECCKFCKYYKERMV